MGYCEEDDVYEESGLDSEIVQNLSGKDEDEVTTLIGKYISRADRRIKRLLKVPITVRKEYHKFRKNDTIELGPYEDLLEFFGTWDPEDCVESVYAIYRSTGRVKLPYPKNCDDLTEDVTDMTATNVTLTKEETTVKCGDAAVKAVWTAANGTFYFPSAANLEKIIYPWDFVGFWFRTSDSTATFTITLYDKDGNSESATFTLDHNDTWEIVALDIDGDFSGSSNIDWQNTKVQKIEFKCNKTGVTAYLDNFNFNDGYFWTYPEGLICWSDPDSDPWGEIEVTYSYDPYKVNTPDDILEASAKLAGVKLLDYCIGCRIRIVAFKQMREDMDPIPEKSTLEIARGRLMAEAMRALAGIGFGHEGSEGGVGG